MFSAKFFVLFFVALLGFVNVAAATPPACLLAVIGQQPDPSDIKTICNKKDVASDISSTCDAQKSAAMSAYASVCKEAGVTVATSVASATGTKSASASATGSVTTPGSSASTPSAGSGSDSASSASATPGAASSTPAPSNDGQKPELAGLLGIAAMCLGLSSIIVLTFVNPWTCRCYHRHEICNNYRDDHYY